MEPATYTLRVVGGVTGIQFAAILGLVNETDPQVELRWREHGLVCSFVAETWGPLLRDRVDRALESELGDGRRDLVVAEGESA